MLKFSESGKMRYKVTKAYDGFVVSDVLFGICIVVVLAVVGSLLYVGLQSKTASAPGVKQPSPSNSSSAGSYAVLSPATVPSKTPECNLPITYSSDGNLGSLTCSGGELNVTAWEALAALEPQVMTLGYSATISQIQSALCADATDSNSDANTTSSSVIEGSTYQISALYYGWNFSPNPDVILNNGNCQ
ncbi:MAG: hypothetical protein ACREF5_01045 [Candidatus Saccharimonadales bacterium]